MNVVSPSMTPGHSTLSGFGQADASVSAGKWAALQDARGVVAMLAGLEPERPSSEAQNFPALMREAPEWRRDLAARGIEDMAAVLEPGIAALLGVTARGADPRTAALALWHELTAARAAVLAQLPPAAAMESPRSA